MISKKGVMKVSKKTLEKLHKPAGEQPAKRGKRVTLEEALIKLLEDYEIIKDHTNLSQIKDDRRAFLTLLEQKFPGAQPEDFKEYDYEDIGTN